MSLVVSVRELCGGLRTGAVAVAAEMATAAAELNFCCGVFLKKCFESKMEGSRRDLRWIWRFVRSFFLNLSSGRSVLDFVMLVVSGDIIDITFFSKARFYTSFSRSLSPNWLRKFWLSPFFHAVCTTRGFSLISCATRATRPTRAAWAPRVLGV